MKIFGSENNAHKYSITFPGTIVHSGIGDDGADNSAVSRKLMDKITFSREKENLAAFQQPVPLRAAIKIPSNVDFFCHRYY